MVFVSKKKVSNMSLSPHFSQISGGVSVLSSPASTKLSLENMSLRELKNQKTEVITKNKINK